MRFDALLLAKLRRRHIWQRLFRERLTEPVHLNLLSLLTLCFGSFRSKVEHDLIVRPHSAFAILRAADYARQAALKTVTLVEFGVASGAGLMNMARIAAKVTEVTAVQFRIVGFDTGGGMPAPVDYRDHPDLYGEGDFAMDFEKLRLALPDNVELCIGNVENTVANFMESVTPEAPIGFVSFDLDYYSSTVAAMAVLTDSRPDKYLPITLLYFDDVLLERHNNWCGEMLAIHEFNAANQLRKIDRSIAMQNSRIYRRAFWIPQMFFMHTLDHPERNRATWKGKRTLPNPYL